MYSFLQREYPDILCKIKEGDVPLYVVLEKIEQEGIFGFTITKEKEFKPDKALIKKYIKENKKSMSAKKIRNRLLENIDDFTKPISKKYIASGTFNPQEETLFFILQEYGIDTSKIEQLSHKHEVEFYKKGMFEKKSYLLQEALWIADCCKVL